MGNSFILHAIRKAQHLHSPPVILLSCLGFSDFLVGVICQPFLVAFKIAEIVDNFNAYWTLRILQSISIHITSVASLLTLTAVSIDRLLAPLTVQATRLSPFLEYSKPLSYFGISCTTVVISRFLDKQFRVELSPHHYSPSNIYGYYSQFHQNLSDRSQTPTPDK